MLTINHLEVKYDNDIALTITSPITFLAGDRIGIIGSNGAGKSTLVKSILGLTNYKGSIQTQLRPDQIAVHLQNNEYSDNMAVKYIIEAILNTKIKKNTNLQELIHFFNFEGCLNKKYSVLSGGQRQRLTIILVLMQDTPLVFFDEVTSGLDFETRQQLMKKIIAWYEGKDATICMVSHYYEELEQLVNKLLILDGGKVIDFGDKDELFYKYCGNSVIILEKNEYNEEQTKKLPKLYAPEHLIALACQNANEEVEIVKQLIGCNINFKRSNNDIELMSINAKHTFEEIMTTETGGV